MNLVLSPSGNCTATEQLLLPQYISTTPFMKRRQKSRFHPLPISLSFSGDCTKATLPQAFFSVFCLNWWQLVILSHKRRQHLSLVRQIGRTGLCCRVKVRMEGKIQRNHVKQTAFLIKILLLYSQ